MRSVRLAGVVAVMLLVGVTGATWGRGAPAKATSLLAHAPVYCCDPVTFGYGETGNDFAGTVFFHGGQRTITVAPNDPGVSYTKIAFTQVMGGPPSYSASSKVVANPNKEGPNGPVSLTITLNKPAPPKGLTVGFLIVALFDD